MIALSSYDAGHTVLLIGAPHDRDVMSAAATAAGARIVGEIGWAEVPAAADVSVSLIIAAAGDTPAHDLPDLLAPLVELAATLKGGVIMTMREDQIDPIAAVFLGAVVDLLVNPDVVTLTGAIAFALAHCGERIAETVREGETERLRRLNEEVARIAAVLTRLARDGDRRPLSAVADRNRGYEGPPGNPDVSAADIRKAIRARRLRDLHFADAMFEDPAWDMLLDLYAAALEGSQVSVSSLCIAAAVPPTTALRWIARMTEVGLFEREADPFDRRRAFMALSDLARNKMDRYFTMLAQNGLSIA